MQFIDYYKYKQIIKEYDNDISEKYEVINEIDEYC